MAIDSQTPIVPISIIGTYDLMPRGSYFIKKGKIKIIFHPAISVKEYHHKNMHELIEKVEESINQKEPLSP